MSDILTLDWETVRACAAIVGMDPAELEQSAQFVHDDQMNKLSNRCEMINAGWPQRQCGRGGYEQFGHMFLCAQHHNAMVANGRAWIASTEQRRDLEPLVDAICRAVTRATRNSHAWAPEVWERFKKQIAESIWGDEAADEMRWHEASSAKETARNALDQIWGETS